MPRNEEGMGKTNSAFYLVFLWHFAPCFHPDCLVSTLIVTSDESSPLMFCPLYHFAQFSRAPLFSYGNSVLANVVRFNVLDNLKNSGMIPAEFQILVFQLTTGKVSVRISPHGALYKCSDAFPGPISDEHLI